MDNEAICTFKSWIEESIKTKSTFGIPEYQRTYSWSKEQAKVLFEDLLNNDDYFFGLFLLEADLDKYLFIDGQQRFTTIFILLYTIAINKNTNSNEDTLKILSDFIYYDSNILRLSLQEEQNGEFFKKILSSSKSVNNSLAVEYFSQQNIKDVLEYFITTTEKCTSSQLEKILKNIFNSKVLLHTVTNTGHAMKIFELLNDRGKPLTNLESLKSFIMHQVYTKSKNDGKIKEDYLTTIKHEFINIYKALNSICNITKSNFHEDDILRYHYIAFEDWQDLKEGHKAKENLKAKFLAINSVEDIIAKTKMITNSFILTLKILEKAHSSQYLWVKNLYILDRMATFYPLLMAIENKYPESLDLICNYLELYTYRAFGIMNKRTNTGLAKFYRLAQQINISQNNTISNETILQEIKNIILTIAGKNRQEEFEINLTSPNFYPEQYGIDVRYILLKYENYLQHEALNAGKRGYETRYITNLHDIINFEKRNKNSLSVEHIIAQDLVEKDHNYIRKLTLGIDFSANIITKEWKNSGFKKYKPSYFQDNYLHLLGNLVISNHGANASKGNLKPSEKSWSSYKSQEEIETIIEINKNKRGINKWRRDTPFNIDDIMTRQQKICQFAINYWSPLYLELEHGKDISTREPLI